MIGRRSDRKRDRSTIGPAGPVPFLRLRFFQQEMRFESCLSIRYFQCGIDSVFSEIFFFKIMFGYEIFEGKYNRKKIKGNKMKNKNLDLKSITYFYMIL